MKKYVSLFFAVVLTFSMALPASGTTTPRENRFISDDTPKISAETIDTIFSNHTLSPASYTTDIISEAELPSEEIEDELSHIYLDIYYANKTYTEDPTQDNELALSTLVERKNFFEQTLAQRGYIFLNDEESISLMGDLTSADGQPPPNTANTRYVASPSRYVTLSDGSKVKYFYVMAYAESPYSNMVRQTVVELSKHNSVIGDFVNSLIQTYVGKIIGEAVSLLPGGTWWPYEMLAPGVSNDITCHYSIKATYTTTPRFIWSLSKSLNYYLLDGVTHQTQIEDHHMITYTKNGASHTDDHNVYYAQTTDGFHQPAAIVKKQWETYAPKPHFEYTQKVNYYYQFDEDDPNSTEFITSEKVPYAISYLDMN